ncbi:hypothetical protein EDB84DRAFT_1068735 [Lactarius hengduanensis]|nr:hypothetical protein EDB84DRAFT_1068735 [Lactarius hengduanensis]
MARALPSNIYAVSIDTTTARSSPLCLRWCSTRGAKRAQEEIDSLLGHGHLPEFGDKDALPYLKAVLYELLRWGPPGPIG